MYTENFDYYRADSVEDAIELLGEHDGSELLAGAQGILTRMKTGDESPPALVDIGNLDGLSAIEASDGALSVGALATHAEVADSKTVADHAAALSDAAGEVGDLQVRNAGTVGGNLAHGDPRSDPPAAVLALDGSLVVQGPDGEREIPATDLFDGSFETSVGEREVVTRLELPVDGDAGSAYHKYRNPLSGYALVGVAASVRLDGDTVREARVAATGITDCPFRLEDVEDVLEDEPMDDELLTTAGDAAKAAVDADDLHSDPQASSEFRAHLLGVYTERVLADAVERAE
ncbi:FAD binding domain-containing protein [Haladaptatus sp. ZSTT2]|uniref:FAD binding domain-containing protein n=1 Tax=Haladaptatus sp. ZSTT2 TaxID=3120515 RepID=UPI00300EF616